MFYVGLDIHTKRISICALSETGRVARRSRVRSIEYFPPTKGESQRTGDSREVTRSGFKKFHVKIESGTQVASRGRTWRIATPLV
jgi:hypothetical protein